MTTIIYKNALILGESAIPELLISKITGEGAGRVCIKIDGECEGYVSLCGRKVRLCYGEAIFDLSKGYDGVYEPHIVTASKVFKCAKFQKTGDRILYSMPSEEELAALEISLLNTAKRLHEAEARLLALEEKTSRPEIFRIG